jgi:hypothetical protein
MNRAKKYAISYGTNIAWEIEIYVAAAAGNRILHPNLDQEAFPLYLQLIRLPQKVS